MDRIEAKKDYNLKKALPSNEICISLAVSIVNVKMDS